MSTRTIPLTELQPQLSKMIDRANELFERFVITREGRAEAVLLAAEDFESLQETLDILSNTELVQRLVEAEAELAAGGGHSLEEVRERLKGDQGRALGPR
jgi:prevent-host-death family protein